MPGVWPLIRAIKYVLNQHSQGLKMDELESELSHMKEEGLITDCCVANVLDAIDQDDSVDYLIFGTNRYFVYEI